MTESREALWRHGEHFRRRYQRLLPEGLYARVEAKPLAFVRYVDPVAGAYGPTRVRVSILLQVFADRLCGEDLPTLLRGQWLCSFRWNAGHAPSPREVLWGVSEGLARAEHKHRWWQRRRAKLWAKMFPEG